MSSFRSFLHRRGDALPPDVPRVDPRYRDHVNRAVALERPVGSSLSSEAAARWLPGVGSGYRTTMAVFMLVAIGLAFAIGLWLSYPAGQLAFAVAFAAIGVAAGSWLMLAVSAVVAVGGLYFLHLRRRQGRPLWRD